MTSLMKSEASEAPQRVAEQEMALAPVLENLAGQINVARLPLVTTIARGTSDHAASFAKYVIETRLGVPVSSLGPSVVSVYGAKPFRERQLVLAISQSGQSPDLVRSVEAARSAGAITAAMVNVADSPVAEASDVVLPIGAGEERAVAATKSFICSLTAILRLTAALRPDDVLKVALAELPAALQSAQALPWFASAGDVFTTAQSAFVIGRGYTFPVAQEAALKLKETGGLHAEAFSAAEVQHGPKAVPGPGFPVLSLGSLDAAQGSTDDAAETLRALGALVFSADGSGDDDPRSLPVVKTGHELTQPVVQISAFYAFAERLARARGVNPDAPPALLKVTETL
ncbi:MAG: SIS domain-containing protein [Pseudomonadota bacterium]